jgi:hypothetical protein
MVGSGPDWRLEVTRHECFSKAKQTVKDELEIRVPNLLMPSQDLLSRTQTLVIEPVRIPYRGYPPVSIL